MSGKNRNKDRRLSHKNAQNCLSTDVAVIGIGINFPMSDTLEQFWENLKNGTDCIRTIPENRKKFLERYYKFIGKDIPGSTPKEAAFLEHIDEFDYQFFHISKGEAELMDPSQRICLQAAVEAIEDAGHSSDSLQNSRTGVFLGHTGQSEYAEIIKTLRPSSVSSATAGNCSAVIAGRVSYFLDLRGPSMMVNTSCSSSLTAVSLACSSLSNGECNLALAGGVQVYPLPVRNTLIGIESSDGRSRPFDSMADGTGCGEGAGIVFLKPLKQALIDKDAIYAVIKGGAINQDGRTIGISAPSPHAQTEVIKEALKKSGVLPGEISYVEAHGTGTHLGDPIEIEGLKGVFEGAGKISTCAIGAVKSNVGHLDAAAGIAGMVKAILQLQKKELVPTIHFKRYNENINLEESVLYVNDRLKSWNAKKRRCGVSSFGISGTNCHIVMEEAPVSENISLGTEQSPGLNILTLSAKTEKALKRMVERYDNFLQAGNYSIRDICYTSNIGRNHYNFRLAIVAGNIQELREKLILKSRANRLEEEFTRSDSRPKESGISRLVSLFVKGGKKERSVLEEIANYYEKGADIDWDDFYSGQRFNRVHLPLYPFERSKCWVDILEGEAYAAEDTCISNLSRYPEDIDHTSVEEITRQTFQAILGESGTQDDFYELGGDSILAVDIVNRINMEFGLDINVKDFLQNASISKFSKIVYSKLKNIMLKNTFCIIPKAAKKDYYCVTSAQKRMYILNQSDPSGIGYNISMAVRIDGKLDRNKFEKSLHALVERHEMLRTTFHVINGKLVQKVDDKPQFCLEFADIDNENVEMIINSCIKPFDLGKGPLFRTFLFSLGEGSHLLITDMPHIISDGDTSGILIHDLLEIYQGRTLQNQNIQYKDYAEWMNRRFKDTGVLKSQEEYWIKQYSDKTIFDGIPTDFDRKAAGREGDTLHFRLDSTQSECIRKLASRNNTTTFTVLFAVLNILLYRYSGSEDIVAGIAVSGRMHSELKKVAGMFVNTLAIRNRVNKEICFTEFLKQVNDTLTEGYSNQEYPFDLLVEKLDIKCEANRNPLFDVMLVMQSSSRVDIELEGLKFQFLDVHDTSSKVDLLINCRDENHVLAFDFNYCTNLYNKETMAYLWQDFCNIMTNVKENQHLYVREISLEFDNEETCLNYLNVDIDFSKSIDEKTRKE